MKSPFTGGETTLLSEKKEFEFKREKFLITHFYFQCIDTKEEFTTEELDQLNTNQLYNQYREKYSIPFPDEIKSIRNQYDISASKMSEILGLGTNSYRQYEDSEMPSVSNGRLILAAKDPLEFRNFVKASEPVLSPKDFERIWSKVNETIKSFDRNPWEQMLNEKIFSYSKPSEFTGYRSPSLERIENTIAYFASRVDYLWKTKLNKLLFYTDFLNYKRTGYSINGIAYRAIQLGPVPSEYDKLYLKLLDDNKFEVEYISFKENGYVGEALKNKINFNKELFSEAELGVLDEVTSKLADKNSTEIVEISHQEKGWIENETRHDIISYQKYAFDLSAI